MVTTKVQQDGVMIVYPPRALIGETVCQLREEVMRYIDARRVPRILIDFRQVRKMDSGGLGTLVNLNNMAKSKLGRMGVINVGMNINSLIVRSRLINFFECFENEELAVSALSSIV